MADKYVLRLTAGSTYDQTTHVSVPVNATSPIPIRGPYADIDLHVRIRNYRAPPADSSPATSAYFDTEPHASAGDQYSIGLRFTPKPPPQSSSRHDKSRRNGCGGDDESDGGISGADLVFGNDLDRPIRDRLPPGFRAAMRIVTWWIDPGLEGDAYADEPHLYGPALSSFNVVRVGRGVLDPARGGLWLEEGESEDETGGGGEKMATTVAGMRRREDVGMPPTAKARVKWALRAGNRERFVFGYGRTYGLDFFNPYLDFANLALRLPGFQLSLADFFDGNSNWSDRRSHQLRYVLRNKSTGDVYLVIVFTLLLREDVRDDGSIREEAGVVIAQNGGHVLQSGVKLDTSRNETHDDDVD